MTDEQRGARGIDLVGLGLFVLAVLVHGWLLANLGRPFPGGNRADSNIYLELAMNLWRDHSFGTRVAIDYPPLYPMFIAPAFAIADNAQRFATIYFMHGMVLGLASLTLAPAMIRQFGARTGWLVLGALQFLGAATMLGYHVLSEPLFAAEIVAATGLAWLAWDKPSTLRWLALGAVCGLAVCTRRTGLVLPIAVGMLWCLDALSALRSQGELPWRSALAIALGLFFGLLPEAATTYLSGGLVDTYGGNPVKGHLGAAVDSVGSFQGLGWAIAVTARHFGYVAVLSFGAPLALLVLLTRRGQGAPLELRRATGFILLVTAGLIAMTSLHILRDYFKALAFYDLYPRYVDPPQTALVALGLLTVGWLGRSSGAPDSQSRRQGFARLMAALVVGGLVGAGPLDKARGALYPRPKMIQETWVSWGFPDVLSAYLLPCVAVVVMALWIWAWTRRMRSVAVFLALSIAVSWTFGYYGLKNRLTTDPPDKAPAVLHSAPFQNKPDGPMAVVVAKRGFAARKYYRPAFRSDHPVWFVSPGDELDEWVQEHPGGLILVHWDDRREVRLGRRDRGKSWFYFERPKQRKASKKGKRGKKPALHPCPLCRSESKVVQPEDRDGRKPVRQTFPEDRMEDQIAQLWSDCVANALAAKLAKQKGE